MWCFFHKTIKGKGCYYSWFWHALIIHRLCGQLRLKGCCDSWCFPAIAFGVENMATAMDEDLEDELDEKEEKSMMCQPGMHKWKLDQCMVCTVCGDCSGYGASCVSSGRPDRVPGGWEKPHTHTHTNTNRVMITHSIRHVYTDHDYPAIDNIQNKKLLKQYVFWST